MRQKKIKQFRKYIRSQQLTIDARPYIKLASGMVVASEGRQRYQQTKKVI